jgi:hypothetical protein
MRTESDKKRFLVFFVFLVVVAVVINFVFLGKFRIPQTRTEASPRQTQQIVFEKSPVENQAMKQQQAAARFFDTGFTPKSGTTVVAVLAVDENGKINQSINQALAKHFRNDNTQILTSFFKPDFVATGAFTEILDGSNEFFDALEIAKKLNATVFARLTVSYSQNAELNNLISATAKLDITLIPLANHGDRKTWSFTAFGPGFSKEVACTAAEERLIKQIADDTKMVLN